jgi:hypothetical protein
MKSSHPGPNSCAGEARDLATGRSEAVAFTICRGRISVLEEALRLSYSAGDKVIPFGWPDRTSLLLEGLPSRLRPGTAYAVRGRIGGAQLDTAKVEIRALSFR